MPLAAKKNRRVILDLFWWHHAKQGKRQKYGKREAEKPKPKTKGVHIPRRADGINPNERLWKAGVAWHQQDPGQGLDCSLESPLFAYEGRDMMMKLYLPVDIKAARRSDPA